MLDGCRWIINARQFSDINDLITCGHHRATRGAASLSTDCNTWSPVHTTTLIYGLHTLLTFPSSSSLFSFPLPPLLSLLFLPHSLPPSPFQSDPVPDSYADHTPDHRLIYKFVKTLFTSAQLTAECAIISLVSVASVLEGLVMLQGQQ